MAEEETARSRRQRVLLFPFPFQGHINPMLELAAVLHSRSFAITIFHTEYNFDAVESTKHPSYHFIRIPDQICKLRSSSQDHVLSLIHSLNENCVAPFHEQLAKLRLSSDGTDKDTVLRLVLDMHWYMINPVAKRLGVPTLVLRTGSAASLNGFIALPALYRKGVLPTQGEWQLDLPIEELRPLRVRDMISVGNDKDELLKFVERDAENARTSLGIIINTSRTIEEAEVEKLQQDLSLPIFAIGPLHKFMTTHDPPAIESGSLLVRQNWPLCMEWLETHPVRSVLYVSFGSLASMDSKDFTEMAWGLANSGKPFLWVVRPGSIEGIPHVEQLLPDGFVDGTCGRGMIVDWAPQTEVLKHRAVGGFWTHCGWNSTLESISEGVPMICTPFFSDQMGNTRYITEVWKVGVELRRPLERAEVENAVRRLMTTTTMTKTTEGGEEMGLMRKRAVEMQEILAFSTESEGSSHKELDHLVRFLLSLGSSR